MNGTHETNGHEVSTVTVTLKAELEQTRKHADGLREQLAALEHKKERLMTKRPAGVVKQSDKDLEEKILYKEEQMQSSSLSLKEEREMVKEIKLMRKDQKRMHEWENEMNELNNKRSSLKEALRQAYDELEVQRSAHWHADAAAQLQLPQEAIVDKRLAVDEDVQELLSTPLWKKRLRSEHSVVTKMDRSAAGRAVRLAGLLESVEAAAALIDGLGPVSVRRIEVDQEQQHILIGRGGATISSLQEETGCSLEVRKPPANMMIIAGPSDAVGRASETILELFETQRRIEMVIRFDSEQKGLLFGKGGSTIQRIQQESRANLDIGRGTDCVVRISGPRANVNKARSALADILHLDAACTRTVLVPFDIGEVVAARDKLRRLEQTHGVNVIRMERKDEAPTFGVKVRGDEEGVAAAVAKLNECVERERRVEEVLQVETQHVGMLLGKQGSTINAIQRETGALLDMCRKADEGCSTQPVTVRGNRASVDRALAALEEVLQYKAECHETMSIEPAMMPLLIGKNGEEINRLRALSGAAIDAGRASERPVFKLRGSKEAVVSAQQAIREATEANRKVGDSEVLPWECIDVLVGPDGDGIRALESEHSVTLELPGHNLASDMPCSGTFLAIATSIGVRGRKKHVDAAIAAIRALAERNALESIQLSEDDSRLLASLCLENGTLLQELGERVAVQITYEPLQNTITFRGEAAIDARVELFQILAQERPVEAELECQPTHAELLLRANGESLQQLQAAALPAQVSLQPYPPMLILAAPARLLEAATAIARAWLEAHRETSAAVGVPAEVLEVLQGALPALLTEHFVRVAFEDDHRKLMISGADKLVGGMLEAVHALVRKHALEEASVALSAEETALVQIHLRALRSVREGVTVELLRNEKTVLMRGTAEPLAVVKGELDALLGEAEGCAVQLTLSAAQMERLHRPQGREREVLVRKLQEVHEVALLVERSSMLLSMRGREAAVAAAQKAMELVLDVDDHERVVPMAAIPVIIGRAGANIKRLKLESGASFDLDRASGRLRVQGTKAGVAKGCELLDELLDQNAGHLELRVHGRQVPLIIGRGGATIRQLQADSGASIAVSKEEHLVRMRGSKAQVELAMQLVQQLIAPPPSSAPPPSERNHRAATAPPPGLGAPPPGLLP